jgi:exo-beta-1,3-glucanase (GH17 family)
MFHLLCSVGERGPTAAFLCASLVGACSPRNDTIDPDTASGGGASSVGSTTAGAATTGGLAGRGSGGAAGSLGIGGASGGGPTKPPTSNASWVYVDGYQLMVGARHGDGTLTMPTPYEVKGVSWSPMPLGQQNTSGYTPYYTQYVDQDGALLADVHANTVRTYNAFEQTPTGVAMLDKLYARGVMIIMTVLPSYSDAQGKVYLNAVNYFKGHPGILMWSIGNELNYNHLYNGAITLDQAVQIVQTAIDDIHQADPDHPVTVSWGNLPAANYLSTLGRADVWSLNLYPYLDISSRFEQWIPASKKPIIVGEYGADAWNAKATPPGEDQDSQATATTMLTQQIQAYYSAKNPSRPVVGGCIFELADEWFKAMGAGTSPTQHDAGGFANTGVYADGVANEEWWGLVTIDRKPRKAFDALKTLYMVP